MGTENERQNYRWKGFDPTYRRNSRLAQGNLSHRLGNIAKRYSGNGRRAIALYRSISFAHHSHAKSNGCKDPVLAFSRLETRFKNGSVLSTNTGWRRSHCGFGQQSNKKERKEKDTYRTKDR